jgi:hypothetical protein
VYFPFDLHSAAVFDSHIPYRHENGMVCVNQTLPHCENKMGKTQSKPLNPLQNGMAGERQGNGKGMAGERHGNGTVYMNPL